MSVIWVPFNTEEWNELVGLIKKSWKNCNEIEKQNWTRLQTRVCLSDGEFKEKFVKYLNHEEELHKIE